MALGDGTTWDETLPTTATLVTVGPSHIVDVRAGVRSRMALEHEWPASQSVTSAAGQHKFITLQTQAAQPTLAGTQAGVVYIDASNSLVYSDGTGTGYPASVYNYNTSPSVSTKINGLKICVGQFIYGTTNGVVSGLPFLNGTSYTVVVCGGTNTASPGGYIVSKTAASFTLAALSSINTPLNWIAMGI